MAHQAHRRGNSGLRWLVEAAEHLEAFTHYHLRDLHVEQVQMDELFALLSAVKEGEVTEAEAVKHLSRSPHWVWVAMDPVCKLILAGDVGEHTQAMATGLTDRVWSLREVLMYRVPPWPQSQMT